MFTSITDLAGELAGGIDWRSVIRKFGGMNRYFGPSSAWLSVIAGVGGALSVHAGGAPHVR